MEYVCGKSIRITLQAHFEADQFVTTKQGKTGLRSDAIPTVFAHRPAVKRRRAPAPRSTNGPVNIDEETESRERETQSRESET